MDNNKLIAEFMGRGGTFNHDKTMICTGIYPDTMTLMKYHTSWDWLMPVIENIDHLRYTPVKGIEDALSTRHIGDTYNAVVEFIKTYNDEQQLHY